MTVSIMPPHLAYSGRHADPANDPEFPAFLRACETNDAVVALKLASGRKPEPLTYGLNRAIECNHLDLAGQLHTAGAKWDTRTVHCASHSHEGVKWLLEWGYDVNTSIAYGAVLLS